MLELESLKITYIWFSVEFIPKTQVKLEQSSKNLFDMLSTWEDENNRVLATSIFYQTNHFTFTPLVFYAGEEKIDCFITRNLKFTDKCYTKPGTYILQLFSDSHKSKLLTQKW